MGLAYLMWVWLVEVVGVRPHWAQLLLGVLGLL
jgi:hypothetical protein